MAFTASLGLGRLRFLRTQRARLTSAALALLLGSPFASRSAAQSPSPDTSLAFRRAQHLRRGVNTSDWFAQAPGNYGVDRLRTYTTAEDLALIRNLGMDHIRLSIDADPLVAWQQGRADGTAFVAELDRVVTAATALKLAVVLDVHPESRYKQSLLQGTDSVQRFALLWRAFAKHYSTADPELVFFEIMNEPEQTDPYRWQGIQSAVAAQIRAAAPNHTLIASGARWSGLEDLLALEPLADPDVIYTFHDYEPFAFTHQGATWTDLNVQPLRGIPYPSSPEAVAPEMLQEPTLAAQFFLDQYGQAHWDAECIDARIAFAERWSSLHHAPVWCGEFGVHRPFADPAARDRWLHDTRAAFEKHHIGWAMWDYQDSFGMVTKRDGNTTLDAGVLAALGLGKTR